MRNTDEEIKHWDHISKEDQLYFESQANYLMTNGYYDRNVDQTSLARILAFKKKDKVHTTQSFYE